MPDISQELLERLGEAYYTHKKLAEQAEKAAESVDYLAGKGLFSDDQDC